MYPNLRRSGTIIYIYIYIYIYNLVIFTNISNFFFGIIFSEILTKIFKFTEDLKSDLK